MVVIALLAAACGTHRRAVESQETALSSVEDRFDRMIETYRPWHTVNVPVKVELRSPARLSLSGRASMVRDSLIHISMRVFGLEVAVLHATPDSVYCIDKVHKLVVAERLDGLTDRTGLTIGQLQQLLLGRFFVPGEDGAPSRRSKHLKLNAAPDSLDSWTMTATPRRGPEYLLLYTVGASDNQLSSLEVSLPAGKSLTFGYSDWKSCDLGSLPRTLTCSTTVASKKLDAQLQYSPTNLSVDSDDIPSFRRPSGSYRYIRLADLLKTLSSSNAL